MTHEDVCRDLLRAVSLVQSAHDFITSGSDHSERRWIPVTEKMPEDGVLVIVKTKDGAKYFGSAYEGSLMPNIEYWYPLPEE